MFSGISRQNQKEKKTHNNNNNKDPRSELVKDQNNKKL